MYSMNKMTREEYGFEKLKALEPPAFNGYNIHYIPYNIESEKALNLANEIEKTKQEKSNLYIDSKSKIYVFYDNQFILISDLAEDYEEYEKAIEIRKIAIKSRLLSMTLDQTIEYIAILEHKLGLDLDLSTIL